MNEIKKTENLFKQGCSFVLSVARLEQLPPADKTEIAFLGRSNVGKSSLLNALADQKNLAKASNTPGRTQLLNFFDLAGKMRVVDLPGYGFAKAPKDTVRRWQNLIFQYLRGRPNLRRVFLLIDSRHGVKTIDAEVMDLLDKSAVPYQIVLTKTDKISAKELEIVLADTRGKIEKHPAAYPEILSSSSEKKLGLDGIRTEIGKLI